MSQTLIERLDFTVPAPNAAKLKKIARYDELESAGSLFLFDATSPANPLASGVPADAAVIPNIVEPLALATIGSSNPADVRGKMYKPAAFTGAAGLIERSSKGGIHAISPQSGASISNSGPAVGLPRPILKWILDHPDHDWYLSTWTRLTRAAGNNSPLHVFAGVTGNGQQTNSSPFALVIPANLGAAYGSRPNNNIGRDVGSGSTLAPHFGAIGSPQWYSTGTPETAVPGDGLNQVVTGNYAGGGLMWGPTTTLDGIGAGGATGQAVINPAVGSNKNVPGSFVGYRMYIEDLTVSGRTYQTVHDIDKAMYTREVLTAGGRYYGDTFTSPSTLP